MSTASVINSWVPNFKRNQEVRLRLLCFPYAGGGAAAFRTWSGNLPSWIEVWPIQLPGRENRLTEPPFTRIMPLVQSLAQTLWPYMNSPFALFGHSLGALVSFELARHLRTLYGISPVHLFVSGRSAPQIKNNKAPIHLLPESEFLEELRRFNGTPETVLQNPELMQLLIPALRSDFAVFETYLYAHEEPLKCPISVFGGTQDNDVGYEGLKAWRDQTCRGFSLRMFPGDHFFIHSCQRELLQAIHEDLIRFVNGGLSITEDNKCVLTL